MDGFSLTYFMFSVGLAVSLYSRMTNFLSKDGPHYVMQNILQYPIYMDSGYPRCMDSGYSRCMDSGYPRCMDSGYSRCMDSEYPRCMDSGYSRCMDSGYPRCMDSGVHPVYGPWVNVKSFIVVSHSLYLK